jgi:deoxyribonuclease I
VRSPRRVALAIVVVPALLLVLGASGCRGAEAPPRVPEPPRDADAGVVVPPADAGAPTRPTGNVRIRSFDEAKKLLVRLYVEHSPRRDVYCGCPFAQEPGRGLRVDLAACGYASAGDTIRAERIEWEHAVPAAKFGRTFTAWREGDVRCVDGRGKAYHGRTCARLASPEFARMEADLHNLFPAVGEVNGLRGDLPMGLAEPRGHAPSGKEARVLRFGACTSAVEGAVFQPRVEVRGDLARAYVYMDAAYPEREILDDAHRALFAKWDREDPPDAWERERNRLIEAVQGNANPFVTDAPEAAQGDAIR